MALRVGLDLVDVDDVAASLRGAHGARYLERIYTAAEVEDCRGSAGEVDPRRLAARFAAKEATIKALPGAGEGVPLTQIEVRRETDGSVAMALSGRAAELLAAAGGEIAVSLTHEGGFAAAAVIIA